jgi:hypothetical protein
MKALTKAIRALAQIYRAIRIRCAKRNIEVLRRQIANDRRALIWLQIQGTAPAMVRQVEQQLEDSRQDLDGEIARLGRLTRAEALAFAQ